jgi:hypothetical protein
MRMTRAEASRESEQPRPRTREPGSVAGWAGLLAVTTLVTGVVVGARPDIADQSALSAFLEADGARLFLAWLVTTVSGLAWLGFIVGIRAGLPDSVGRDVFTFAAVAGQVATWIGSSLDTATAPQGAHDVPVSVYAAFGEAGHLAGAAGIAATGLALTGLASAMRLGPSGWPRSLATLTMVAGGLLILTAPIGPVSLPVLVLWTTAASVAALRLPPITDVG